MEILNFKKCKSFKKFDKVCWKSRDRQQKRKLCRTKKMKNIYSKKEGGKVSQVCKRRCL